MINLVSVNSVYLFNEFIDFRYGMNSLVSLIYLNFKDIKEKNNCLFVFCSKKRNQLKIIELDSTGIWLYTKKLNEGKFIYPSATGTSKITTDELKIILNGLDFIFKIEGKYDQKYTCY